MEKPAFMNQFIEVPHPDGARHQASTPWDEGLSPVEEHATTGDHGQTTDPAADVVILG